MTAPNDFEATINHRTDEKFWAETGLPHGHRLDRANPRDAALINRWLELRYETAEDLGREFAETLSGETSVGRRHGGGGRRGGGFIGDVIYEGDDMPRAIICGFRGERFFRVPERERIVHIAPMLRASAVPSAIQFRLDGSLLRAQICIDGRCYDGAIDIAAIAPAPAAAAPDAPATPDDVAAVDDTVTAAGDLLVSRLVGVHCGGWFDSIEHAVSSAVHGVEHAASSAVGTVGHTLNQLKGPIAAAAGMAAGAAALAIPGVGPLVAPLAGSLAKNLVDAATGSGSTQKAAQQVVAQATAVAQSNPQVAAALNTAKAAVAKSTAGYHVAQTVANAAAGNPDAQAQVADLASSAAQGDPDAAAAMDVAQAATGAADDAADAVSSGWFLPSLFGAGLGYAGGHFNVAGKGYDWLRARFGRKAG